MPKHLLLFFKYKYIFCFKLFLTGKRSSSEWRRSRSGKTFKKSALVRCSFRCNGANFNCSWNCISYGFLFIIQIRKKTLIGNHHSLNNILCTRWIGKARNYYEQKHIVKKLQSLCCTDALKGAFSFTCKEAWWFTNRITYLPYINKFDIFWLYSTYM